MIEQDYLQECNNYCETTYNNCYEEFLNGKRHCDETERNARREAIIKTALLARERYEDIQPSFIWRFVQKAHIKKYTNVEIDPETVELIMSARQSWVKASGHAFEEMVKKECNEALDETDIVILLQRDLHV